MATLYEYYNTGDDTGTYFFGDRRGAQTFTPQTAHKITSVKLKLYRSGSPGTVFVSIKAVDVDGHPTGDDLCSGTTDGSTLPTGPPYEWREITLGDGYNLLVDTKYAVVIYAGPGDLTKCVRWRMSNEAGYANGARETSHDAGETWNTDTTVDLMFEEWGEAIAAPPGLENKSANMAAKMVAAGLI
ncbi:hypothetical protein ES706_04892 [subsurface metagenome]